MTTSPHHPVAPELRKNGDLHLVGSRSFGPVYTDGGKYKELWTDESDWDYYLGVERRKADTDPMQWAVSALEAIGLVRLPGEGGPYGRDQLVEGVWRLPAAKLYGTTYPHVDVVLGTKDEIAHRMKIWSRIVQTGSSLPRGLKSERAWGSFWWVTRVGGP